MGDKAPVQADTRGLGGPRSDCQRLPPSASSARPVHTYNAPTGEDCDGRERPHCADAGDPSLSLSLSLASRLLRPRAHCTLSTESAVTVGPP